jgi:hypothetical protein
VSTSWFTLGLRADVLIGILIISSALVKLDKTQNRNAHL